MPSAMTQMQQSLLSGMMMPKRDEADGKSDKIKSDKLPTKLNSKHLSHRNLRPDWNNSLRLQAEVKQFRK